MDPAIETLIRQIRALLATTAARSYVPYWSMHISALAREVNGWAKAPPAPARRAAVEATLRSLHAQITHHMNAA